MYLILCWCFIIKKIIYNIEVHAHSLFFSFSFSLLISHRLFFARFFLPSLDRIYFVFAFAHLCSLLYSHKIYFFKWYRIQWKRSAKKKFLQHNFKSKAIDGNFCDCCFLLLVLFLAFSFISFFFFSFTLSISAIPSFFRR